MSTGIFLPVALATLDTNLQPQDIVLVSEDPVGATEEAGIWTPPQYSEPALTVLSVVQPPYTISPRQGSPVQVDYVFDAVFRISHVRNLQKTSHPVLTGANISDHAYMQPVKVSLEIGMSDVMASYAEGIWTGFSTKSISAWQVLKSLQQQRTLITLTTRLDTYVNMMVINVSTRDDYTTKRALKATIVLEELLAGSTTSITNISSREQSTGETAQGTIQSQPPNPAQVETNVVPSDLYPDVLLHPDIPGAGDVSSNSLSQTVVPFF